MRRSSFVAAAGAVAFAAATVGTAPALAATDGSVPVTVGSPPSPFSQNKQNEPALAVDQSRPNVLVAGSNDNIDMEACNAGDPTTCPFTPNVGVSGVYFSFDSGHSWTQPTYHGLTARDCLGPASCTAHPGPIGTLPWYAESGLVSDGDPAVAFGPKPDASGHFSWANGSRLYYANLTSKTSGSSAFRGFEAIAVSRTDNVVAAAANDQSAWMRPVIVSARLASTTFSDKEQVWADNAASSRFFGHVYVCWASFRSNSHGNAYPVPLEVATSADGGATWTTKQVGPAASNGQASEPDGCTVRTDSQGNVYVFGVGTPVGTKTTGEVMYVSHDGGAHWVGPRIVAPVNQVGVFDPVQGRPVLDGIAGARVDLAVAPSVDIANGAPTGSGATNRIILSYVNAPAGHPLDPFITVTTSANGGLTWSTPSKVGVASGDRPSYVAPAIAPDGSRAYLTYNAFTTPYRTNTTSPRGLVGVFMSAPVSAAGLGSFTALNRGTVGDPRGSSTNALGSEFLGDYVYSVATRRYGGGVWNDTRNAADCPAIDAYRAALEASAQATRPAVQQQCPATFGNSSIYGYTTAP